MQLEPVINQIAGHCCMTNIKCSKPPANPSTLLRKLRDSAAKYSPHELDTRLDFTAPKLYLEFKTQGGISIDDEKLHVAQNQMASPQSAKLLASLVRLGLTKQIVDNNFEEEGKDPFKDKKFARACELETSLKEQIEKQGYEACLTNLARRKLSSILSLERFSDSEISPEEDVQAEELFHRKFSMGEELEPWQEKILKQVIDITMGTTLDRRMLEGDLIDLFTYEEDGLRKLDEDTFKIVYKNLSNGEQVFLKKILRKEGIEIN